MRVQQSYLVHVTGYPLLIDVTLEELETGLESGLFTSVDLVNVGSDAEFPGDMLTVGRPISPGSKRSMTRSVL